MQDFAFVNPKVVAPGGEWREADKEPAKNKDAV